MKMIRKLTAAVLLMGYLVAGTGAAETSVGVSIGIHQPGVYGRIDIGNYPQPVLVRPQPVIIVRQPMAVQHQPVYLYVPPGHRKNWKKHCHRYNACGEQVYFVKEQWVRERYEHEQRNRREDFRDDRRDDRGDHRGNGSGHDKGRHDHDNRR